MDCIEEGVTHDSGYKWSVNEYDLLNYDVGNMNCNCKIIAELLQ